MFFPRDHYAKINDVFLTLCGTQQHNHPPKKGPFSTSHRAQRPKRNTYIFVLSEVQAKRSMLSEKSRRRIIKNSNKSNLAFFLLLHSSSCRLHLTAARPLAQLFRRNLEDKKVVKPSFFRFISGTGLRVCVRPVSAWFKRFYKSHNAAPICVAIGEGVPQGVLRSHSKMIPQ